MNNHYDALSISSVLINILTAQNNPGIIAGVYKKTVNFAIGDYLITITDVKQRNLPYGLLCDFSEIDLQQVLKVGDAVDIDSEKLCVRNRFFEISLNTASIWSPEFYMPIHAGDIPFIQRNITRLEQLIIQENNQDGLVPLCRYLPNLMNSDSCVINESSNLIEKACKALRLIIKAMRNFDEDLLIKEFILLTGLGIGLTPSGDDILMGLMATMTITSQAAQKKWILSILNKLLPQIKELTTDVSSNFHKAISQGYYPERFSNLISKIISAKNPDAVQPAFEDMLKWGHTSGYEIILGMIIGLSLSIENLEGS